MIFLNSCSTGADDEETSKQFLEVLNEAEISSKLKKAVCIKVQNGTQPCNQFSQLYPVILVPSIYFIDSQSGTNIETTGGTVEKEKIISSVDKAFEGRQLDVPAATIADRYFQSTIHNFRHKLCTFFGNILCKDSYHRNLIGPTFSEQRLHYSKT